MEQHGVAIGTYLTITANPQSYSDPTLNTSFNVASSGNGGNVTVSWSSGTSTANRLEKIITQKWLANYPLGFEAWNDFRRTNYPRIIPAVDNLGSASTGGTVNNPPSINPNSATAATAIRLVRRLPYPVSEYNGNSTNVEAAVSTLLGGPDVLSTNLWWAKKP
jgi:hypothetical protein